jgi:hypothetical protein
MGGVWRQLDPCVPPGAQQVRLGANGDMRRVSRTSVDMTAERTQAALRGCRRRSITLRVSKMIESSQYRLNISRRGPPPRPFGWEICRRDNPSEVERSADTFRSRYEAIQDGERALKQLNAGT